MLLLLAYWKDFRSNCANYLILGQWWFCSKKSMPLKISGLFTKRSLQLPDETSNVCWHIVNLVTSLQIAYQCELSFVHCNLTIFAFGIIFSLLLFKKKSEWFLCWFFFFFFASLPFPSFISANQLSIPKSIYRVLRIRIVFCFLGSSLLRNSLFSDWFCLGYRSIGR